MTSRERIKTALLHAEADHVPLDLGGAPNTSICAKVYERLRRGLKLEEKPVNIWNVMQQLAFVDEDVLAHLGVDTRPLILKPPSCWKLEITEKDGYKKYTDEWGLTWQMPVKGGHYFDIAENPLRNVQTVRDVEKHRWPDPTDKVRFEGLAEHARKLRKETGAAIMLGEVTGGPFEITCLLMGYERCMMDMISEPKLVQAVMEKVTEFKCRWYETVLPILGNDIDIVLDCDDVCGQNGPLLSPKVYRQQIKPLHKKILGAIAKYTGAARYFHSCGSVYEFIGDFIENGVQILNPIQVSAANMDTRTLKREFGKDLVFWGGGCDTQEILSQGSIQEVKEEVKRRIDDLAPGGGFIFAQVHNIQNDVPVENLIAMWEAWAEYGTY